MKICFFNSVKKWGGGEKWHLNVAVAFSKAGHDVVVVSGPGSELAKRATTAGIRTCTFSLSNLSFLNPFKQNSILNFFRREKFDAVIFNFSRDLKSAALCAKLAGIPRIIYRRGLDTAIKNNFINRFIFKNCLTDVLANSQAVKDGIRKENPNLFPEEKIKIIYNGVDIGGIKGGTENISNNIPIIGSLGRCVYQKGQDILLDVAAILKNRGIKCKVIIGGDGPLLEKLKKQSKSLDVDDMVEFAGFVENPNDFMRGIDIFVLASRYEGLSNVIIEAMAHSKPVVAFNTSSNPELVSNDENGYLVDFGNLNAFADALVALLSDKVLRTKLGRCGREIAEEKFDFNKNMQQVLKYLM